MPSKDPLSQLQPALRAIPAADVREPNLPMAVFNQQGADLVTFLEGQSELRLRLRRCS